ncbi:MAG: hypothetical protein CMG21_01730 [Candidatus Marinimicrobia bacterium]|nr:hypothetical protein [Candidatus Neomarinimicrobiota bacterium]|tara:strand:- start:3473 stop:3955 length:483 start_codon:yes stop_codon:yes gene_type:complete
MMTLQILDKNLKKLLIYYLVTLGIGFSLGVLYVYLNSEFSSLGMIEQYVGNNDDWAPKLPKTLQDLVSHTHEHITMFAIIFLSLALIFSYNNTIKGFWKRFLMLEPFISIIITFGGFFIIRYITTSFSYIIIASSLLMYMCFYIMLFVCLYELILLNKKN